MEGHKLSPDQKRLHWKCRRGILELDIFLEQVLTSHYPNFDQRQRELFNDFLVTNDQLMIDWLLKKKPTNNPDFDYFLSLQDAS